VGYRFPALASYSSKVQNHQQEGSSAQLDDSFTVCLVLSNRLPFLCYPSKLEKLPGGLRRLRTKGASLPSCWRFCTSFLFNKGCLIFQEAKDRDREFIKNITTGNKTMKEILDEIQNAIGVNSYHEILGKIATSIDTKE